MSIICKCGHLAHTHLGGKPEELYAGCRNCDCELSPDTVEARYWAGRMMEKRNFIWGRWEELFTVHNDLLKWADRIMKNYKELEAEHDELKIRLNAAESGSLEQAEEYMELKAKYDKAEAQLNDAISTNAAHYLEYLDMKDRLGKAEEEICRLERYNGK